MTLEVSETSQEIPYPFATTWTDTAVDAVKGFASYISMPFWSAEASFQYCLLRFMPGEYGQEESKVYEYAKRAFILLFAIPTMIITFPFVLGAFAVTGLARLFESENYRYFSGNAKEVNIEKPKYFHLNMCGFYGGLPYALGGTTPANERISELVDDIHQVNPDLLFLCECNRMLTAPFYYHLKDDYSHFFVDIGLNAWGMENSLFVAARVPIVSAPEYIPFNIALTSDQKYMQRGFFAVETEDKWYIYTHLHPRDEAEDRAVRSQQLDIIQTFIDEKTGHKPCMLLGDLNIDRLKEPNTEYQEMLARGYKDYFAEQHPDAFTGSDILDYHIKGMDEEAPKEVIDYILIHDKGTDLAIQIDVFETYRERLDQSHSDHKGLIGIG